MIRLKSVTVFTLETPSSFRFHPLSSSICPFGNLPVWGYVFELLLNEIASMIMLIFPTIFLSFFFLFNFAWLFNIRFSIAFQAATVFMFINKKCLYVRSWIKQMEMRSFE